MATLTDLSASSDLRRIRALLAFFIIALVFSGLTAIPLSWDGRLLVLLPAYRLIRRLAMR